MNERAMCLKCKGTGELPNYGPNESLAIGPGAGREYYYHKCSTCDGVGSLLIVEELP